MGQSGRGTASFLFLTELCVCVCFGVACAKTPLVLSSAIRPGRGPAGPDTSRHSLDSLQGWAPASFSLGA